jgi:hypothetical protein
MRTTMWLFVILFTSTALMAAGLSVGPEAAVSAFLVISIGLGAHVAHGQGERV